MPKATFYTHVAHPTVFACRLAVRATRDGGRLLLWSDSTETLTQLDRELWQFEAESFLAHEIWPLHENMPSETPILLACGHELPSLPPDITVLNLSPDFWTQAPILPNRVLEIVGPDLESLADARERFKAYRQHGFEIEHHNMQAKA